MWQTTTVGELAAPRRNALVGGPFGSNLVTADYVEEGVPVIRGQNMGQGRWVGGEFVFVSAQKAEDLSANLAVPGDLVFTQRGTLGQVALVPQGGYERYIVSQSQMKLSVDEAAASPLFLYYLFSSPEQIDLIKSNSIQTGVPHTNLSFLRAMRVKLPPLEEQHRITTVLGSLDDKIELNRRMNQTLEAMARAIFKSWFVDFEPFNAVSSGSSTLVPSDWKTCPIGDAVTVLGGSTPSTTEARYWGGNYNFATPKDLADLVDPILLDTERTITAEGLSKTNSGLLSPGTVLLSSRAPIGYLAITDIPVAVNQGFIAMVCDRELPSFYVLQWARHNMETIIGNANGTTFLEISKKNFRPIEVIVPPKVVLDRFVGLVAPLYRRIASNLKESRTLSTLRDTLLPKLLSGEIRVKQAEKAVAEVV